VSSKEEQLKIEMRREKKQRQLEHVDEFYGQYPEFHRILMEIFPQISLNKLVRLTGAIQHYILDKKNRPG
jgi:hypothetical protein